MSKILTSLKFRTVNTFTCTLPSAGLYHSEFSYGYQVWSSQYVLCAEFEVFCCISLSL